MAEQDPQRGRGNGGPPDLDDIFRGLGDKLNRFFGGSKGGNGVPGSLPPNNKLLMGSASAVGALLGVLWLASGFYVVDEREDAVILRFGSYVQTVTQSGLHWHMPWPVETREVVNVTEVRSLLVGGKGEGRANDEASMLTGDQNIIEVQLEVQYNIKSAQDFVFNNRYGDKDATDIVKQAAETAIREVVGRNQVDYVLNEGRGAIASQSQVLIQVLLDKYATGISVARVNISDVQPPEPVQAAFSDAVKARQDKARLINEGQAYANDVIPKAKGMAARLLEEAEGYRAQVVSRAEGDAARFRSVVAEYSRAPAVTRDRIYLETMQAIYSNSHKVLVDQRAGGGNLLYLPLDKLLQQTAATEAAESAKPSLQDGAAALPAGMAKPDSRSRGEREGR